MGSIRSRAVRVAWTAFACALVPASTGAAAAAADYYLKIEGHKGEGGAAAGSGGQIEILSFHWGPRQSASADGSDAGLKLQPGGGGGAGGGAMGDASIGHSQGGTTGPPLAARGMGAGKVAISDSISSTSSQVKREQGGADVGLPGGTAKGTAAPPAVSHDLRTNVVARTSAPPAGGGGIAIGLDGPTGQAAGQHIHMHQVGTMPAPPPKGSLRVRAKFPGCTVGARYPAAELSGAGTRYTLTDIIITGCAAAPAAGAAPPMDEVSLDYARVQVRGWNPETKEK